MQQVPHLHLLYTPWCKVAHPFPHFTKEIRASFGNASQNLLLFMQSSKIWILCKCILFWFFWSLCLRDSVIFAQYTPCVSRSRLDSLPSLRSPSKQACGTVLCSETPALFVKRWLEVQGAPFLMPGGAGRPLGVISSRCPPVTTKPFCSYNLGWENDHLGRWDPPVL